MVSLYIAYFLIFSICLWPPIRLSHFSLPYSSALQLYKNPISFFPKLCDLFQLYSLTYMPNGPYLNYSLDTILKSLAFFSFSYYTIWSHSFGLIQASYAFKQCLSLSSLKNLIFFNFFNVYLFLRERGGGEGQKERETQNPKQAVGSELSAKSTTRGSNPRSEIMTWAKVRHLTDWTTQAPLEFKFKKEERERVFLFINME